MPPAAISWRNATPCPSERFPRALPLGTGSAYIEGSVIGDAMIDHTSLGVRDYDLAVTFYTACLAPLGYSPQRVKADEAAFGTADNWGFFLYPVSADKSIVGEKNHVAFRAGSRDAVAAFNHTAVANGAKQVRPVGPRPDIGPEYYGTVLTDPDGHTLEAVFWDRA